jgi:hypothetical protein
MPIEINISCLDDLIDLGKNNVVQTVAGDACLLYLQEWLDDLGNTHPNKFGAPRQFYWEMLSKGTTLDVDGTGATITIPAPFGQSYRGGDIYPKTASLLTIPARMESYGHRARDFSDLHFIKFKSGAKALAQDDTGLVYFWLASSVHQEPHPELLPTDDQITDVAVNAIGDWWISKLERLSGF